MPRRIPKWFTNHPNFFAFILVVAVFLYTTNSYSVAQTRSNNESQKRLKAFCGLVYLFDQSIKLQGTKNLGPLQIPYDNWKKDVEATNCPKKPDVKLQSTTTTIVTKKG